VPRAKSGIQVRFAVVGVVVASTTLAACSYLPDAANPTTWNWRRLNPASWFEGDSAKTPTAAKAAPQSRPTLADRPGTEQPFPSVNSTPAKPTPAPVQDRRAIAQGLQADRDNARYTDEVLRASGPAASPPPAVAAAPPPPPPPAQVARVTEPPPPAAITTPAPAPEPPARQPSAVPAPPAPLPQLATTPPVAPVRAVPVPSSSGVATQQPPAVAGRAAAVPVPSVLDRPQPSATTAPVMAQPIPSVVPAQSTYTQTSQMTQVAVPAGAASAGMPVASSLPSRPGVQVNPSGPAALPSGFVPGSGRTPLLARVYAQGLAAQQARSVAEIPAGFQAPGAQPIGQFATDVPPIVQQSFNASLAQYPPSMPVNPAAPAIPASAAVAPAGVPAAAGGVSGAALIHFDAGATRVSANMRDLLSGVVAEHRQRGGLVRVIGYANARGDGKSSTNTSLARAQAVSRELARLGIPGASLVTEGLGDTRPIFDESTSAGAAENRRVEIYLE